MPKINVYPNNYRIRYTDYKGIEHTTEMRGLTIHEAIIRFRARNITAKNVTAIHKPETETIKEIMAVFH